MIRAPQGQIITLEIEDFDMEPERDFVLIRDGERPDSPELKLLTGAMKDNPQFIVSTGNRSDMDDEFVCFENLELEMSAKSKTLKHCEGHEETEILTRVLNTDGASESLV